MVGQNCHFDYTTSLQTIELMKAELEKEGLSPYLMMQPPGYHVPEANKGGMSALSEYPFGTIFFLLLLLFTIFYAF